MKVTPYEYAKLSQISYTTPDLSKENFGFEVPVGWRVLKVSSDANEKEGFFGVAFKKDKEIVIALRGADFHLGENFNDIVSDLPAVVSFLEGLKNNFDLWAGNATTQFAQVKPFIEKVINQALPDNNITFTGHSLGGTIAELASVIYNKHATVFDSPGIGGVEVGDINIETVKNFDITIYNGAPNIMNTVNTQVVKPIALNIDTKITGPTLIDFIKFCFEQHPMSALITKFDQNSGELVANSILTDITTWPSGAVESYQYFGSYDQRKAVWDNYISDFWNKNTQIAIVSGKEVHVQDSFASFDHFKESFIRRELVSKDNNPLKIIEQEIGQLLSGKETLQDSDLVLGLQEFSKVLKGDLDLKDAVRTKTFGEIVLKYAFNVFILEAWPSFKKLVKEAHEKISNEIDEIEEKLQEIGHGIKEKFSSLFSDKKVLDCTGEKTAAATKAVEEMHNSEIDIAGHINATVEH